MSSPETSHQNGAIILILPDHSKKEQCMSGWHRRTNLPPTILGFSVLCEHQLPPCVCVPSTHAEPCFRCHSSAGVWTWQWLPISGSSHRFGSGRAVVCQGRRPAPAACSRHRVCISSSSLTRHRSLRVKGREKVDTQRQCTFSMRQEILLVTEVATHLIQILCLARKVKVFLPLLLPTLHDYLIRCLPSTNRPGCCLWDQSVWNKVCGPTGGGNLCYQLSPSWRSLPSLKRHWKPFHMRWHLPPPQSSPSLLQKSMLCHQQGCVCLQRCDAAQPHTLPHSLPVTWCCKGYWLQEQTATPEASKTEREKDLFYHLTISAKHLTEVLP